MINRNSQNSRQRADTQALAHKVLPHVLRPIVRFCLRYAIHLGVVVDALKEEFVTIAKEELARRGDEESASKLSVMTGVHRKDVSQIVSGSSKREDSVKSLSLYARIIGAWQQKDRFRGKNKRPRTLMYEGVRSEFGELVRSISSDLNPYTVLNELERIGAVEKTERGVRLLSRAYSPRNDATAGFSLLERDMNDLMLAVEGNVLGNGKSLHHHGQTEYDNIPAEACAKVQSWLMREGSALHERARIFLSQFDRDLSKTVGSGRYRVSLGSFSRIHEFDNHRRIK